MAYDAVMKSGQTRIMEEADAVEARELLKHVGDRVRRARQRMGYSRRVLSQLSGVSPRYLAQLEMGGGNISISLLLKIANALDYHIEWLLSRDDPGHSDAAHMQRLFESASSEQRQRVLDILAPRANATGKQGRIALIGLRGAGKSTLGPLVAARLKLSFAELNHEIEKLSGMPVEELMAMYGMEGYRRLERQALDHIVARPEPVLLAVAGGIVGDEPTYELLLAGFHTIWLKARPRDHMERVRKQGDDRPMAGNPKAMDDLRSILTSREALYARADEVVDTSGKTPQESMADVVQLIEEKGFLSAIPRRRASVGTKQDQMPI